MAGNGTFAICDLLDGLALDGLRPPLVARFETEILAKLDHALDHNVLALQAVIEAADVHAKSPRIAAAARLTALLLAHEVDRALEFGLGLGAELVSAYSKRLMSRLLLSHCRIEEAIVSLEDSLRLARKSIIMEPDLGLMVEFWQSHTRHLRDTTIYPPRYRMAVCSVIKNEADDIAEWIVHHAGIGVEAFYIYDNGSTDDTPRILDALSKRYTIIRYSLLHQPAQSLTYWHFLQTHRFDAEWAALIDADEFINPESGSISGYLDRDEACAGIAMNWSTFGSSGHKTRPQGLCIESFIRRAPDDFMSNAMIKGIIRPHRFIRFRGPHQQLLFGHYEDGLGNKVFPINSRVQPPRHGGLRLHHYLVKSEEQAAQKMARGNPRVETHPMKYRDRNYFQWNDCNDLEDTSMLRFAPAIHETLAGIPNLPPRR